jgi:DNA ligase-1
MKLEPMLACKVTDRRKLRFPLMGTPKLDGIRCLKYKGQAMSRSFKPIPNERVRALVELTCLEGVDGELIVLNPDGTFKKYNEIMSIIMSEDAPIDGFRFYVFDLVLDWKAHAQCQIRMLDLQEWKSPDFVVKVTPTMLWSLKELDDFEEKCLAAGHEGVCLRDPAGPYKFGRSTMREGWLLKMKRFEDSEAEIIGFEEKLHNANEATLNAFGRTERSSHKAGMVPAGTLGALLVQDGWWEFSLGTGFSDALRQEIWDNREQFLGKLVKYKYQPHGSVDSPRFPTFLGFRDKRDL